MYRLPFGGHGIPWIRPKIGPQKASMVLARVSFTPPRIEQRPYF